MELAETLEIGGRIPFNSVVIWVWVRQEDRSESTRFVGTILASSQKTGTFACSHGESVGQLAILC